MTDYYLVNAQDDFATGFSANGDQISVATAAGFDQAVVASTDDPDTAKYALYAQAVSTPAATSDRETLTEAERRALGTKLDAQFRVLATSDLTSC